MRSSLLVIVLAAACGGASNDVPNVAPTATPTASVAPPVAAKPVVTKRVVVSLSRKSGTDVTTVAPDGTITVALDVLQNGRGPHTDATIKLAPDGTIASLVATGHHEMKTPVDERFTRDGDTARWKSHEEDGHATVSGSAFFLPVCDLPDTLGWLAQAMLRAGGTMKLLPSGEAKIEKTAETEVTSASGEKRRLVGYAITGPDLTPTDVWMNEDGSWFGVVSAWWSVVPEGWESAIEPLIARQNEIDRARDKRIAQSLAHPAPAAGLAFTHARVLDVEHGRWLKDQTVLVVNGLVKSVGPAASARIPAGAETIDLGGKALLPGLWDMHSHLDTDSGALDIASGVTTARDVGNDPDKLDDWKARFDDGSAVGPHVLRMGFIEGRGPLAASAKVTAETPEEAKAAVAFYAQRHYDGIKIYNSVKPELVPLLASEAHARHMLVTGHIPVHMLANEAVRAGYDGIEHINMVLLNFLADHDTDTRTPLRFTVVGDKAASLDLKSKPVTDFVALLKSHDTLIDPTLDAFEYLLVSEPGKIIPGLEWMVARLPVQTQRQFLVGGVPIAPEKIATYRASFEKCLAMVKLLHDAKVPEVVGTDMLAGLYLDHELDLFVRAGISPADALKMDTIDAARAMKLDKQTGSIAPGKVADMFVVDGDPLAKISDVRNVVSTMRAGVLYASDPLFATVGVVAKP